MPAQLPLADQPLFFLDYDGTLAPIVDDPSAAYPHPAVPDLLQDLARLHPVYIVTGRHLRDLDAFLPDLSLPAIGLHGAQEGTLHGEVEDRLTPDDRKKLNGMRESVPSIAGVWVEDKEHTFAVHYRGAAHPEAAAQAIAAWAATAPDTLNVISGKDVVELRPAHLHKGTAVQEVAARRPNRTPVYLGDDVTDEDAFRALPDEAITVKVGEGETAAQFHLPDVPTVVAYLHRYID